VSLKPLRLLHIDDSSVLRKTISRGLESFKDYYVLTQAESVDEALNLMSSGEKFDVILTDWLMNGKSGLDLLCILKAHPSYHHLPVFFLTSEYDSASLLKAVTFGASGIIKKPTTGPDLHSYIQKRISFIEECETFNSDFYVREAQQSLNDLHQFLPLKSQQDLTACLQHVQNLRTKSTAARWPMLAEYSQKIDDAIQATLKAEAQIFTPMSAILSEYDSFIARSFIELENGRPHEFISETTLEAIKSYHSNIASGWFSNKNACATSSDGILIPHNVAAELQKHLSLEGQNLLAPYLNAHKKAS
jgi:CheY-like chemotaxis protein